MVILLLSSSFLKCGPTFNKAQVTCLEVCTSPSLADFSPTAALNMVCHPNRHVPGLQRQGAPDRPAAAELKAFRFPEVSLMNAR